MSVDALSDRLGSRLKLQQRTLGEERIKRARERDEDVAIFSMVPLEGDPKFRCCLGVYCLQGDPRRADPGDPLYNKLLWRLNFHIFVKFLEKPNCMLLLFQMKNLVALYEKIN